MRVIVRTTLQRMYEILVMHNNALRTERFVPDTPLILHHLPKTGLSPQTSRPRPKESRSVTFAELGVLRNWTAQVLRQTTGYCLSELRPVIRYVCHQLKLLER